MVFKCQEDSFLKEFETTVVSCEEASINTVINGNKTKLCGYEVILGDTILFPEGGGQPCDYGYLNDVKVLQVTRKADKALHFIEKPLDAGSCVKQQVDWDRRFDHMQQHSGQHLITAIADREYGFSTVSWWLGEDICHIELDTPEITSEQLQKIENIVNELIRERIKVKVDILKGGLPSSGFDSIRSRGLPDDHVGDVRVITIEGIESNMCCGTHVTNLSQLQVIKLLHTEKYKKKDNTLLYFLAGQRVLKRLTTCIEREQKLTTLLNNGPLQHVELIDKLQKNLKATSKNLQSVLKDLAKCEADRLKALSPMPKYFVLHRKDAESDFLNVFLKEVGPTDVFMFLSVGDERGVGNIMLQGDEKAIAELGIKISDLLQGKGAGKGTRFQAKVNKMANREKAIELVKNYFVPC